MMSMMMENMTMTMMMTNVDDDDIFQKPPWGERVPEESEGWRSMEFQGDDGNDDDDNDNVYGNYDENDESS